MPSYEMQIWIQIYKVLDVLFPKHTLERSEQYQKLVKNDDAMHYYIIQNSYTKQAK